MSTDLSCFNLHPVSPSQVAQLVRASSRYAKAAGSILGQGTYKNQLMSAQVSGTTHRCFALSLSPPTSSLSLKSINKYKNLKISIKFTAVHIKKTFIICSFHVLTFIHILIEFIGVTLIRKTIQVSNAKLNRRSSAHCIVHHPLKQRLFLPPFTPFAHLHLPHPRYPEASTTFLSVYVYI